MKKIIMLALSVIMLMTVLTACKTNTDSKDETIKTGNDVDREQSKDEVSNNSELLEKEEMTDKVTDQEEDTDKGEVTDKEEETGKDEATDKGKAESTAEVIDSSLTTVDISMAEEVGSDVHLAWQNLSTRDCDGIEVYRAESENGDYEIIATVKEELQGYISDGYIDQGSAGKGYYYGARLLKGKSHSEIGSVRKAAATEYLWYKNDSSYLRVIQQPEDPNYLIQFSEYDLLGNRTWNCDWPCTENEEVFNWQEDDQEYTRTFQYCFATPIDDREMDVAPFTYYVNMSSSEFTLTMYHYDEEQNLPVFEDTKYSSIN